MKKTFSLSILIIIAFLFGCQSQKKQALHQIKILSVQLDSVNTVYSGIDWEYWSQLNDKISSNTAVLAEQSDRAIKLDSSFVNYFGAYSTAGKILSRTFRKSKTKIEEELQLSQKQLNNLTKDIKAELIPEVDSVTIYIEQEQKAMEKLIFMVSTLEISLSKQQQAYDSTYKQVEALVSKLMETKPNPVKNNEEIHYTEDQEQE
ncbi:MAG: hypothetical protein WCX31_05290 [Salinivirgaceae bacterium]